jgi:hypothetical protein
MKPWIKILIVGVLGFGGGFVSGFFVHKKLNDVKFEEISEEEMAEIEANFKNDMKTCEELHERIQNDIKNEVEKIKSTNDLPDEPDDIRIALQGKTPYIKADTDRKKAYEKMWQATKAYSNEENANKLPTEDIDPAEEEYPDDDEYEEEAMEALEQQASGDGNSFVEPPHVISLSDFYNDRPEYDKVTIEWFEPDDVWIDEKEDFIPDIRSYIGMEVKSLFASNTPTDDPDVRFVRNEQYGSDYEIIRHHRSWRETAGGS